MTINQEGLVAASNRGTHGTPFFAAYSGASMSPTLHEADLLEVVPYGKRPVRVGDVVLLVPPRDSRPVVHRVSRVTPAGISTLGDNNTHEDSLLSHPRDIKGQVVAVWRAQKRSQIAGGFQGRFRSCWLRCRRIPGHGLSHLLHPLYRALSHWGLIARLLPARFRPRVVVFRAGGQNQVRLLLGQRVVGRYDDQKLQWQIQRPFRVFVNERMLQRMPRESRTTISCPVAGSGP